MVVAIRLVGAAALAVGLATTGVQAQDGLIGRFALTADENGGVWRLDKRSGAVVWCRLEAPSGPKVVDLVGGDPVERPVLPGPARPDCVEALAAARADTDDGADLVVRLITDRRAGIIRTAPLTPVLRPVVRPVVRPRVTIDLD